MAEIERRLKASAPLSSGAGARAWLLANGPERGRRRRRAEPRSDDLERLLRQWFGAARRSMTLGDVHTVTGCHLLLGLHNLTTDSPWRLSSNPEPIFNRDPVAPTSGFPCGVWSEPRSPRPDGSSPSGCH